MGRQAEGWRLYWRGGIGYVRFRWKGKRHFESTGRRDSREAAEVAARIYSDVTTGRRATVKGAVRALAPLDELLAAWLQDVAPPVLRRETHRTYEQYAKGRYLPFFERFDRISSESIADFARSRLSCVYVETLKKELYALTNFLGWALSKGLLSSLPTMPKFRKTVTGTRAVRRETTLLTTEQVELLLTALPELSDKKPFFLVRARILFAYETGLRPSTLSQLLWSDVSLDKKTINVRDETDKAAFGRSLCVSDRATEALHSAWRHALDSGAANPSDAVFGRHNYTKQLLRAERALGLPHVKVYDLRHSRGTHLVAATGDLTGVAYLLGHKRVSTTNRYVHPSEAAGRAVLMASGAIRDQKKG